MSKNIATSRVFTKGKAIQIALFSGMALSIFSLLFALPVSAHVTVRPAEVLTASFHTFTVSVPNEKDTDTRSIKVIVPGNLRHVTPTVKHGWYVNVEKEGSGEGAVVKSITWSKNSIPVGFRDEFTFSAQAPADPTNLEWKAYQTYADKSVVAWELEDDKQPKKNDGSPDFSTSGPFSVTKVQTKLPVTPSQTQKDTSVKQAADRALYVGVAGIGVGLAGIFLATRKSNRH